MLSKNDIFESDLPLHHPIRYARQIIVPHIGIESQIKLYKSKICIVGMGGLGSPVLMYLSNTGIESIGIVDFDLVEISNLQRQVIHKELNINRFDSNNKYDNTGDNSMYDCITHNTMYNNTIYDNTMYDSITHNNTINHNKISKVDSAFNFVKSINSTIKVIKHNEKLTEKNIHKILQNYEIIVDCGDSISLRYLINDYCVLNKKALVSASVLKWEGQIHIYNPLIKSVNVIKNVSDSKNVSVSKSVSGSASNIDNKDNNIYDNIYNNTYYNNSKINNNFSKCFRCLFPTPKSTAASCDQSGVIGPMCGVIGSMQATEVMKIIIGYNSNQSKLIIYNGLTNFYKEIKNEAKKCFVCSKRDNNCEYDNCECKDGLKSENINCKDHRKFTFLKNWADVLDSLSSYQIVDIRNETHFRMLRIKNSIRIDFTNLIKNKPVLVFCYRGNSSVNFAEKLISEGFEAYSMIGGIEELKRIIE